MTSSASVRRRNRVLFVSLAALLTGCVSVREARWREDKAWQDGYASGSEIEKANKDGAREDLKEELGRCELDLAAEKDHYIWGVHLDSNNDALIEAAQHALNKANRELIAEEQRLLMRTK